MKFSDNEKSIRMRVDNLISSTNELLRDLVIMDLFKRCLTRSLSIIELEGD